MKKRIYGLLLALTMAAPNFAQTDSTATRNIDFEEDTTQIVTLNDIIAMQNQVAEKNFRSRVIQDVWKYKKFFSISYASTSMNGKKIWLYNPETKAMEEQKAKYTSDWGVSIKRSQIVAFHKKPISEVLSFGLEYSFIDLSFNHYSQDKDMQFDSRLTYQKTNENGSTNDFHHYPWGSEMYNVSEAMHLGPSITLAPFTKTNNANLAFLRLQGYFTVGYRASLLWINSDMEQDVNNADPRQEADEEDYKAVDKSGKLSIGHGVVTNWGIRLNWKHIGIAFEKTKGNYKYQSLDKTTYGSKKHKFMDDSRRITFTYIW